MVRPGLPEKFQRGNSAVTVSVLTPPICTFGRRQFDGGLAWAARGHEDMIGGAGFLVWMAACASRGHFDEGSESRWRWSCKVSEGLEFVLRG